MSHSTGAELYNRSGFNKALNKTHLIKYAGSGGGCGALYFPKSFAGLKIAARVVDKEWLDIDDYFVVKVKVQQVTRVYIPKRWIGKRVMIELIK